MSDHVFPSTVRQAGDPRGQEATWTLLPVDTSDGRCSQCAILHEPGEPHNPQSVYYQYAFYAEHGRWPGWKDAMAHCTQDTQELWTEALKERGVIVE